MKIGIDCRMLGPGFGLARYVQQLVMHLQKIDKENQYVLFTNNIRNTNWYEITKYEIGDNFKVVEVNIPWYTWEEQIKFKSIIKKAKVNLMHFPHWNVPLNYNDPFVVTIHDLIMYKFPRSEATTLGPIKFWLKDRMHRLLVNHAVKKAKHIIVTSEFTRQDVHETLGVELDKMSVTYQAPFGLKIEDLRFQNFDLNNYGITKKYVLYVGAAYPHKNLGRLLQAWELFQEKYGDDYQLVLVGKENYFYKKLIQKTKNQESNKTIEQYDNVIMKQSDNIIFTDYLPDSELTQLYQHASLYVFPSLYEGFGLPPLEAQQYNVPVVSSSASCLPEVLGESAMYFDPENVEQMADVIYIGLTNEDVRFELQNNARGNLTRFSWEKLARKTLGIYIK